MPTSPKDGSTPAIPSPGLWQAPLAWAGSPLRPVENYSREFPASAMFVRGELIVTLAEQVAPGMTRQTERALPGLIRLEKGKPVEVHATGVDGRCWTYRLAREGRKSRWALFVGAEFPAQEPAPATVFDASSIERVVVQSILPMAGTRRFVSFAIGDAGMMEDFSRQSDPDAGD